MEELINTQNAVTTIEIDGILHAFEHIVELAADSNLNDKFFNRAQPYIDYANAILGLTPTQVVLLALFIDRSEDRHIRISEIAKYIKCNTTRILRLSTHIDRLEELHYVRASRSRDGLSYRVPFDVITALKQNRAYDYKPQPIGSLPDYFDLVANILDEVRRDEITYDNLCRRFDEAFAAIAHTYFARALTRLGIGDFDVRIFSIMAHLYIANDDDNIGYPDFKDIFDDDEVPLWYKHELRDQSSPLFAKGLIENANEDGMARPDHYRLTQYAKSDILSEIKLDAKVNTDNYLTRSDSFPAKDLFYNPHEARRVDELRNLLMPGQFDAIQSRLKDAGMRTGFCVLLYGAPGTGKTETVYQIARATGRDIMRVDVEKIKSCWVGKSEQNLKDLFDRYRKICATTHPAPILLFNEADALLGIRLEGATRSVDKMENAMQNIILQEMEALQGIMIATTNLTTNLDKAFERRFLYKILFNRPSAEARTHIWQTMIPALAPHDALQLATKYDLTGGEIENISRKYTVNAILTGCDHIDLASIMSACDDERIASRNNHRIGF